MSEKEMQNTQDSVLIDPAELKLLQLKGAILDRSIEARHLNQLAQAKMQEIQQLEQQLQQYEHERLVLASEKAKEQQVEDRTAQAAA